MLISPLRAMPRDSHAIGMMMPRRYAYMLPLRHDYCI